MRKRIAVAAAALFVLVNGALVDDQQPPWAGFYVGGQGGQLLNARVSGNLGYNDPAFPGIGAADLFSPVGRQADLTRSAIFGLQGGYNWQAGFLVGGVEADMSYVAAKGGFDGRDEYWSLHRLHDLARNDGLALTRHAARPRRHRCGPGAVLRHGGFGLGDRQDGQQGRLHVRGGPGLT